MCQMWWMVLIHKTEIWFKLRDIDVFRNCIVYTRFLKLFHGIRSSVHLCIMVRSFFIFKLILYVCNLLSKWDEYSFYFFFAPLCVANLWNKPNERKTVYLLGCSSFITVIVCSFHGFLFVPKHYFCTYSLFSYAVVFVAIRKDDDNKIRDFIRSVA